MTPRIAALCLLFAVSPSSFSDLPLTIEDLLTEKSEFFEEANKASSKLFHE